MDKEILLSKEELSELKVWKPYKYIIYGAMNITLIIILAVISVSLDNIFVYLLCWLLQGTIFISYSNAAHECTHGMMTPNKNINRFLGAFWMTPLLINYTVHKNYHLKHHANTTCEGDPEFNFEYDVFPNLKSYFLNMAKWLTIYDPLHRLNWKHSFNAVRNQKTDLLTSDNKIKRARNDFIAIVAWLFVCITATIFYSWEMIAGYWIPVGIFMPILAYVTAVPEHYDVKYGKDSLFNTRTIDANPIISFLFWHFNFHTAHHYNPSVPFYSLPKLHKKIKENIKYSEKSYLGFHLKTMKKILNNNVSNSKKIDEMKNE